jgi:hypothetical protein
MHVDRIILTHTLHPKMFRQNRMAATVIQTNIEEIRRIIAFSSFGFHNAFGNREKLPLVERALTRTITYTKEQLFLQFGDLLLVTVVEQDRISYWNKIYVWDPTGETPQW